MTFANSRPDALARMRAVHQYEILDTPPEGAFDRIAGVAARTFSVPIGIVSIVDTDRIWFKSHHGLPEVQEIGRDPGLCASAILQNEPWVVTDASVDPRTLANPAGRRRRPNSCSCPATRTAAGDSTRSSRSGALPSSDQSPRWSRMAASS
jgi:hypothetical protein